MQSCQIHPPHDFCDENEPINLSNPSQSFDPVFSHTPYSATHHPSSSTYQSSLSACRPSSLACRPSSSTYLPTESTQTLDLNTPVDARTTCVSTTVSRDQRQLSVKFICDNILELVRKDPTITIPSLIAHILSVYTYKTTYMNAWKAKEMAIERIYGNWEESYRLLPHWLLVMHHYLPGTVIDLQNSPVLVNGQQVPGKVMFRRLFWSFHLCIQGFRYCKPLIQVDGTCLYGKYRGILLMAIAQDGNMNSIPIAYALVEGETADAWFFFLERLRMFVTPQADICLISDRHESIKSAVRRLNSNWQHVFCIRHIAQDFMRAFSDAEMRKVVIDMGYSMNQPAFTHYRNKLSDWNEDAVRWVDEIPKEQWIQAFDGGQRWGHMTTNLDECINKVLRGISNLPITSLVKETYHKTIAKFVKRGRQAEAMMASGVVYTEKVVAKIEEQLQASRSHEVHIQNRSQSIFRVIEFNRPRTSRPAGSFKVDLKARWCDCGEFQALHYPCSHVIAACLHINHDYKVYVSPQYTVEYVFNVYSEEFPVIQNESYWPQYTGPELCHNPATLRDPKGLPQSTQIRIEIDQRERTNQPKRCGLCRSTGHNKNRCPKSPAAAE